MDALPILGAFVGGIGGGIFASRMVRMQLDKFKKELELIDARIDKLEEDIDKILQSSTKWHENWGEPMQLAVNALSDKIESMIKARKK